MNKVTYIHVSVTWFLLGFLLGIYLVPSVPLAPLVQSVQTASPIDLPGFSVLIIYESEDLSQYPLDQVNILFDKSLRQLLDETCSLDPKTNTKQYRILDKDAGESDSVWKKAMERPRASLPWLIVSNGKIGIEVPLPRDVNDTKALINKLKLNTIMPLYNIEEE